MKTDTPQYSNIRYLIFILLPSSFENYVKKNLEYPIQ